MSGEHFTWPTRLGSRTAPVKLDLLENGKFYSFAQALRILALRHRKHGETTDRFAPHDRVHPDLSLAFPATDMVDIRYIDHDGMVGDDIGATPLRAAGMGIGYRIDGEAGDENGRYHVSGDFSGTLRRLVASPGILHGRIDRRRQRRYFRYAGFHQYTE